MTRTFLLAAALVLLSACDSTLLQVEPHPVSSECTETYHNSMDDYGSGQMVTDSTEIVCEYEYEG